MFDLRKYIDKIFATPYYKVCTNCGRRIQSNTRYNFLCAQCAEKVYKRLH